MIRSRPTDTEFHSPIIRCAGRLILKFTRPPKGLRSMVIKSRTACENDGDNECSKNVTANVKSTEKNTINMRARERETVRENVCIIYKKERRQAK